MALATGFKDQPSNSSISWCPTSSSAYPTWRLKSARVQIERRSSTQSGIAAKSLHTLPQKELLVPIKPWDRKSAPNLTDAEYAELADLVDKFPQFKGETDPDYKRWEALQRKVNGSTDSN